MCIEKIEYLTISDFFKAMMASDSGGRLVNPSLRETGYELPYLRSCFALSIQESAAECVTHVSDLEVSKGIYPYSKAADAIRCTIRSDVEDLYRLSCLPELLETLKREQDIGLRCY